MARRKVGEPVGATHRLHVVHVALATEVAGGREIDLEGPGGGGLIVGCRIWIACEERLK